MLHIGIFTKHDGCSSDEECARKLGFDAVAKLHQVHGSIVHVVTGRVGFETKGDGLITKTPGLALSIRWADCQGFVIYAPESRVLGMLHVGWRGLAAKAITAFYTRLEEAFAVKPGGTFVGITPSLCGKCAVYDDAEKRFPEHMQPFVGGGHIDLTACADHELDAVGVPGEHRERHPACTCCNEGFWSWRRDRREDARNHLVAGLL